MKTVLVLNQFALPRSEGGGTRHVDLFSRVKGWRSVIVAGNRNHYGQQTFETDDEHFTLVPVPQQDGGGRQRLFSWLAYSLGAVRLGLTTRDLHVVYASTPHLLAPFAGWVVARIRRVPLVVEVRDLWPESFVAAGLMRRGSLVHRAFSVLEKFVVTHADAVVTVVDGWEQHFDQLGVDSRRLRVIPNGTEPADLSVSTDRETLRRDMNISGQVAVFAGAHGPKDGIDLILEAADQLPSVSFLLYGDGPSKNAAIKSAADMGLSNVFFRDPVPKEQLGRVLKACDIGIHSVSPLPVFALGMSPNKLFDYLACGLPVVSNAGEPVSRLLGDTNCGLVGGPHSLASNIRQILALPREDRMQMSAAGSMLVEDKFSRKASSEELTALLNNVVRTKP